MAKTIKKLGVDITKIMLIGIIVIVFLLILTVSYHAYFIAFFMVIVACGFLIVSGTSSQIPAYQSMFFILCTFVLAWGIQKISMFSLSTYFEEGASYSVSNIMSIIFVSLFIVLSVTVLKTKGKGLEVK